MLNLCLGVLPLSRPRTCRTLPSPAVHVDGPSDPRREPHDVQVSAGRAQELALVLSSTRRQTAAPYPRCAPREKPETVAFDSPPTLTAASKILIVLFPVSRPRARQRVGRLPLSIRCACRFRSESFGTCSAFLRHDVHNGHRHDLGGNAAGSAAHLFDNPA